MDPVLGTASTARETAAIELSRIPQNALILAIGEARALGEWWRTRPRISGMRPCCFSSAASVRLGGGQQPGYPERGEQGE
jgi:hypothetical protein